VFLQTAYKSLNQLTEQEWLRGGKRVHIPFTEGRNCN
jgi:hypothetical protein